MDESLLAGLDAYELRRTLEIDAELGGDAFTLRIEILQAVGAERTFRARFWKQDLYRHVPSFPRDDSDEPTERADVAHLVDWAELLEDAYDRFEADDVDDATKRILGDLRRAIDRASPTATQPEA